VSQKQCEIGRRLLLITNRKSCMGFQLPMKAMTLDDPEHENRGFYGFFGNFGLQDTFQQRIAPNSLKTDQDKLHMKFSALNVDFNGPSLDLLNLRKPAHDSIKKRYQLSR